MRFYLNVVIIYFLTLFLKFLKPAFPNFFPTEFEVDCSGKRKEWEGIVVLPMVDVNIISEFYNKHKHKLNYKEHSQNKKGKSFIYVFDSNYQKFF